MPTATSPFQAGMYRLDVEGRVLLVRKLKSSVTSEFPVSPGFARVVTEGGTELRVHESRLISIPGGTLSPLAREGKP